MKRMQLDMTLQMQSIVPPTVTFTDCVADTKYILSHIQSISYLQTVAHNLAYFTFVSKMTYTLRMLDLLILCFFFFSTMADNIDNHCSSGINTDQKKLIEINNIKYQQYKIFDSECEKIFPISNFKQEYKSNINKHMKSNVQRNVSKREKKYTTITRFIEDHLPAFYHLYNVSTREGLKVKDRLDSIEKSLNTAFTKGNPTTLQLYFSDYKELMTALLTHIQMHDLMLLMSELEQPIYSKHNLDSALNLFNDILIMPELSDNHFLLVAKRYIAFSRLRNDFDSIIDLQVKIVERFPLSLGELSKLGELQYAVRHKSDVQDVFERILELDQYILENVESDPIFAIY